MNFSEKSLNQKISNYAKSVNASDVNKIRTTVVLERLVARIQASEFLGGKVVFCGGFVLYKEGVTDRYTRDVDMISNEVDHDKVIKEVIRAIESDFGDGFWFGDTIVEEVQEDVMYGGIRFKPLYKVGEPFPESIEQGRMRRVHLDLSFQSLNSLMESESELSQTIEQYDPISWKIYPIEFIAADKVHAIITRAGLSTRSKDVYDLNFILNQCDKTKLRAAISYTFSAREMEISEPIYKTLSIIDNKNLRKNWGKVEFKAETIDFDTCWRTLISYFERF